MSETWGDTAVNQDPVQPGSPADTHDIITSPWQMMLDHLQNPTWADYVILAVFLCIFALAAGLGLLFRRTRNRLLAKEAQLEATLSEHAVMLAAARYAQDGIVYQDMQAHILWANPAYCRTMGYELDEIVGRRPQEFCFPPENRPSDAEIESFHFDLKAPEFHQPTRRLNIRKNGEYIWQEFTLSPVEPRPGVRRVILQSRDVTAQVEHEQELERARASLQRMARHDTLTGLLNRNAFLEEIGLMLADPATHSFGLIYLDLNKFKAVNDCHGHSAGDTILTHVAAALSSACGDGDHACRIGGDEFLLAIGGTQDFDTLAAVADTILERVAQPVSWQGVPLTASGSIGLALSDGENISAEDLIRLADFALYEAKAPGAPAIVRYDADLHARREAEKDFVGELAHAIDTGAIQFAFQPILDTVEGRITAFETLARWRLADGTTVPPDIFIPQAARLGRLVDIDMAAMREAAALTGALRDRGHFLRGAFNASTASLSHGDFVETLNGVADNAGLEPGDIAVEVLENTFFGPDTSDSKAAAIITALRREGYSVSLDDFGVGYAGLAHLGQLDVSGIKIDRSLVANVAHDRTARIIASSILHLCEELGVKALAEGIEYAEQAEFLVAHGCTMFQGFGIAQPMDRPAIIDFVVSGCKVDLPRYAARKSA